MFERLPSREMVQGIRERYPAGTRIRLVHMDDVQAPPVGTEGTVIGVDDMAQIMVNWDNGSGLSLIHGQDAWRKVFGKKEN